MNPPTFTADARRFLLSQGKHALVDTEMASRTVKPFFRHLRTKVDYPLVVSVVIHQYQLHKVELHRNCLCHLDWSIQPILCSRLRNLKRSSNHGALKRQVDIFNQTRRFGQVCRTRKIGIYSFNFVSIQSFFSFCEPPSKPIIETRTAAPSKTHGLSDHAKNRPLLSEILSRTLLIYGRTYSLSSYQTNPFRSVFVI